jgi:NADH:ubiquinone oxidoreductase subunit 3 (subunit A)
VGLTCLCNTLVSQSYTRTPYECGFDSVGSVRASFSLHFFKIILVFVIFDLEVVLLISFIRASVYRQLLFIVFMILIYGSYYLEHYLGGLS